MLEARSSNTCRADSATSSTSVRRSVSAVMSRGSVVFYIVFVGVSRRALLLHSDVDGAPSKELETLQKLLHFPEEVALQLASVDFEVFRTVQHLRPHHVQSHCIS